MPFAKFFTGLLENRFNRFLLLFLIALAAAAYLLVPAQDNGEGEPGMVTVHVFTLSTCPHCQEEKAFLQSIRANYSNLRVAVHDVDDSSNYLLYTDYFRAYEISDGYGSVPLTFIGTDYIFGFDKPETTGKLIESKVNSCIEEGCPTTGDVLAGKVKPGTANVTGNGKFIVDIPFLGITDAREYSLPMLAVVLGLVDGFNPCAMWVLVYLIALLMEIKDRKRMWLIVGTFLLASGILYFVLMAAWLNAFLFLGYLRIISVIVGVSAVGFSLSNLNSYYESRGKVVCDIGDAESKGKTADKMRRLVAAELNLVTFGAIVALAFAVNSIEFVCSSALPAIFTQVLALAKLSTLEHYLYILLYVFFFMLDDIIIFSLAVFTLDKSGMGEKYAGISKLVGSILLLIIGILLLFFPSVLR